MIVVKRPTISMLLDCWSIWRAQALSLPLLQLTRIGVLAFVFLTFTCIFLVFCSEIAWQGREKPIVRSNALHKIQPKITGARSVCEHQAPFYWRVNAVFYA